MTLACAYAEWLDDDLYLGNDGHYRIKSNRGRIAPFSALVLAHFPENADFHRAAHAFADFAIATQERLGLRVAA